MAQTTNTEGTVLHHSDKWSESLFSLELMVDNLHITDPNLVCRFPSIAFRLLDFPTLMIYHVESDLANVVKQKLSLNSGNKIPPQLGELKDKKGRYILQKGKSCLYQSRPETLLKHLLGTPLYVMILDSFPEVPRLLGSCRIPLNETMKGVYDEIITNGIHVPAMKRETGEFAVYNLMGSEIGRLKLAYRLYSLGPGIMSHLPAGALTKLKDKRHVKNQREPDNKTVEATDVILEDLKMAARPEYEKHSSEDDVDHERTSADLADMISRNMQTEKAMMETMGTQTRAQKKKKEEKEAISLKKPSHAYWEDFFVSNIDCPPPLFYNSHAVDPEPIGNEYAVESHEYSSPDSDEDTIRVEDVVEEPFDYEFSQSEQRMAERLLVIGRDGDKRKEYSRDVWTTKITRNAYLPKQQYPPVAPPADGNFPLLGALVNEILKLQGVNVPTTGKSDRKTSRSEKPKEIKEVMGSGDSGRLKKTRSPSLPSSPRHPVNRPAKQAKQESTKKSVVNAETKTSLKKTKLTYGMTNTQRLRLSKTNPKLLKTLEEKEKRRIELKKQKEEEELLSFRRAKEEEQQGALRASSAVEFSEDFEELNTLSSRGKNKRPVPTPRMSLGHVEPYSRLDQRASRKLEDLKSTSEEYEDALSQNYNANSKNKSNDPSSSVSFESYSESSKALGVTRVVPPDQSLDARRRESKAYSDDFEDSESFKSFSTSSSRNSKQSKVSSPRDPPSGPASPGLQRYQAPPSDNEESEQQGGAMSPGLKRYEPASDGSEVHSPGGAMSPGLKRYEPASDGSEVHSPGGAMSPGLRRYKPASDGSEVHSPGGAMSPGLKRYEPASDGSEAHSLGGAVSPDPTSEAQSPGLQQYHPPELSDQSESGKSSPVASPRLQRYVGQAESDEESKAEGDDSLSPQLQKYASRFENDSELGTTTGIEVPNLQEYNAPEYSSDEEMEASQSVEGEEEDDVEVVPESTNASKGFRIQLPSTGSSMAPTQSYSSPIMGTKGGIRPGLRSTDPRHVVGVSESVDSTAYISRSQIPSDVATSESYSEHAGSPTARPRPSPRKLMDRVQSLRTESVSSYAPSEGDANFSLLSETFEDDEDDDDDDEEKTEATKVNKYVKPSLVKDAKLGYTWT